MMQAAGLTPPAPAVEPIVAPTSQEPWLALDAHFEPQLEVQGPAEPSQPAELPPPEPDQGGPEGGHA